MFPLAGTRSDIIATFAETKSKTQSKNYFSVLIIILFLIVANFKLNHTVSIFILNPVAIKQLAKKAFMTIDCILVRT